MRPISGRRSICNTFSHSSYLPLPPIYPRLPYLYTYVCISSHIFVCFKIAEAAVSYFLKKLATVDFVLKEEQLAAVNSSLLYSINCTISITRHKSTIILHADLDSNSSFMEPEWEFLHVSSIYCLLALCKLYVQKVLIVKVRPLV